MQYIVISRSDSTTMGPFSTEDDAIAWAKTIRWLKGYFVRPLHPITDIVFGTH